MSPWFELIALLLSLTGLAAGPGDKAHEPFTMKVIASNLESPWEVLWGPDQFLWVTERTAGRIVRIDPETGTRHVAAVIADVAAPSSQSGLLGLAIDPGFLKGIDRDFVYAAYTYATPAATGEAAAGVRLAAKIVRFSYDFPTGRLVDPVDVIARLPASTDHNGGRLRIGPDDKLYYSVGDLGRDQWDHACVPIEAQRLPSASEIANGSYDAYQGKSLRLDLDGSIPGDNPVIAGVRSHVFTYGHRNMQGMAFAPDGTLYAAEQGPKTDDEINILSPGRNYGWPRIAGFRDDMAYVYERWADAGRPCSELSYSDVSVDKSVPGDTETSFTEDFEPPIATMYTVAGWDFSGASCPGFAFICWPTIAPSSLEVYVPPEAGIPGWENALVVTSLKRGSLYILPLAADGRSMRGPMRRCFAFEDRFRDLAFSPDLRTIYVATDSLGATTALGGGGTDDLQHPGSIIAFTYLDGPDGCPPAPLP